MKEEEEKTTIKRESDARVVIYLYDFYYLKKIVMLMVKLDVSDGLYLATQDAFFQ